MTAADTIDTSIDTWTYFEGRWQAGNAPIMGPRTHAAWLGSTVFDGARTFGGAAPDLDLHCARVNTSAEAFLLEPRVSVSQLDRSRARGHRPFSRLARSSTSVRCTGQRTARPGGRRPLRPRLDALVSLRLPRADAGAQGLFDHFVAVPPAQRSRRRPSMPRPAVSIRTGARALIEAYKRGFGNCLMLDMLGNVAELANSNVFMAKGGVVYTPVPNGTFLDGITRRRVIALLEADGVEVRQVTLRHADFLGAEEIFASGNFAKVVPITRIEARELPIGPFYRRARALYWEFAASSVEANRVLAPVS